MLTRLFVDFHIHTALSACADSQMTPDNIIRSAVEKELDVIAITDHNSAENIRAVMASAQGQDITVVPGMEVQTREEVHLVCLFADLEQIELWQEFIYRHLPVERNREDFFGEQWVFSTDGKADHKNSRLLITSTSLSVEETVEACTDMGGLCFPAHVDRPNYSIISNLGFIPPDAGFITVELSPHIGAEDALKKFPYLKQFSLIGGSDAHYLKDITWARSEIHVKEPTLAEIKLALLCKDQRKVVTI
jgi:3',5'-nucleoside bisphosphate phosphatase